MLQVLQYNLELGGQDLVTKVDNPHFTIQLPNEWEERANANGVEWVTPDGAQQVIVTVALPRDGADLRQAVETLRRVRKTEFANVAGGVGSLESTGIRAENDTWIGTMVGVDAGRRVLTFARIVATRARVVTAAYFRYGTLEDAGGFVRCGEEISSTLVVSKEPAKLGWRRFLPW